MALRSRTKLQGVEGEQTCKQRKENKADATTAHITAQAADIEWYANTEGCDSALSSLNRVLF